MYEERGQEPDLAVTHEVQVRDSLEQCSVADGVDVWGDRAADEYRTQWSDMLRGIGRTCADTMQSGRCEGTPQITIAGVDFTVGASAKIHLLPWAATYHNLQDDWEFFARQPSYALAPWEPEARIDMLWRFCLLRDRNLCPNHPVKLLKTPTVH